MANSRATPFFGKVGNEAKHSRKDWRHVNLEPFHAQILALNGEVQLVSAEESYRFSFTGQVQICG